MINMHARQDQGESVQPERVSDILYRRLASMIGNGEYGEGDRLPSESDLSERFSVSRSMVREVLLRLRESGLIVSRKGSGSFVLRKPAAGSSFAPGSIGFAAVSSLAQVKKGYEFRIGVEGEAAYWAAQNRSEESLAKIRTSLEQLEEAIELRKIGVEPDYEFHLAIARASANEFFETVLSSMRTPITFAINLSRSLSLTRPIDRLRTVQAEHVAIFEAIKLGDKEGARLAMRTHIGNTCDRVFEGSVEDYGGRIPP